MSRLLRVLFSLVFGSLLLACFVRAETKTPAPDSAAWDAFGQKLASHFENREWKEAGALLDTFALSDRALKDLPVGFGERIGFQIGFSSGLQKSLYPALEKFSTFTYQRQLTIGGEIHLRFRCRSDDGGFNFLSFVCQAQTGGGIKWVDMFSFATGEFLTATTRRALLPLIAKSPGAKNVTFSDEQTEYLSNIEHMQTAMKMHQDGDSAGAFALLNALPDDLKSRQFVLLMRFTIAQSLNEEEYLAVIEEWERLHPKDPALDLIAIDSTFLRKDYAGTVKRIDSLSRRLGAPDAYLLTLKANAFIWQKKPKKAREAANQALQLEPSLAACYDVLLTLALEKKDFREVTRVLTLFDQQFPAADINAGLADEPSYADYLKSSEYRAWMKSRSARVE